MKKNILTVVIMAATVINLVLTIVLVFSIMPAMNKTTNLIDKVASVIDLEIEDKNKDEEYTMADLEPFEITYEKAKTFNLAPSEGDDKDHFLLLNGISISFNTKAEDFNDIKTQITTNSVYAEDLIKKTASKLEDLENKMRLIEIDMRLNGILNEMKEENDPLLDKYVDKINSVR